MLFNERIGFKKSCRVKAALESIAYYPFHMHEDVLEIICVINGKYKIANCAHDHILSYGDLYFFNARDSHKIEQADENCILLSIQIDLNYYKHFFLNFDGQDHYNLVTEPYFICDSFRNEHRYSMDIKYLRFLIAKIYVEYTSDRASDYTLEKITKELIEHILNHNRNYLYAPLSNGKYVIIQQNSAYPEESNQNRIYRIVDYIYDHSREKISLDDVAKLEYLNPSYLSSYIKKTGGLSFSEFLSLTRCEDAERLLSMTSKNVDEIAREVGFSNRNHLTAQFKKWFFKTPSQYRKEIIADLTEDSKISYNTFDYEFAMRIIDTYLDGY